jgi:predicted transcriptional regulator
LEIRINYRCFVHMSKKRPPETSIDARNSLRPEDLADIYQKILKGLERLGTASNEQLASYLTIEHSRIWKRVSELNKMGLIFRPGHKVPTKTGRQSFVWQLCSAGVKTDRENKKLDGPSVVDYTRTIASIQKNMF